MAVAAPKFSKKQIDKAGKRVRTFYLTPSALDEDWSLEDFEAALEAMDLVEEFRASHAKPIARVNAGLRYYVKKAGMAQPEVTQRLKRFSTIVDKLKREPTMALSKMEDIAGVRAVLVNQRQADAVCSYLQAATRWKIRRIRNYVDQPKPDGYRAIHVVVEKDGCFVEIQLRTPWQDSWAQSVEEDTRRLRAGLKFGAGPDDLREYYRAVSVLFAMRERGEEPTQEFMEDLAKFYAGTRRYFPDDNGERNTE